MRGPKLNFRCWAIEEEKLNIYIHSSCLGRYNNRPSITSVIGNTFQYMCYSLLFSFLRAIIWHVYRTGTRGSSLYIYALKTKQDGDINIVVVGAFAKLRKATISFVMSISPHGSTRLPTDGLPLNLRFMYFCKSAEKIQVSFKHDKNNGYLT
jgi:hypothetical protein